MTSVVLDRPVVASAYDCPPEPAAAAGPGPLARLATSELVVPLVDGRRVPYTDLDHAASTPPLEAVTRAVAEASGLYASVHRGAGWASQVSTAAFEHARARVGAFVGARDDDEVIFTRNTTDALTLLASAVPGSVVHLDLEHHANLLPWRRGPRRCVRAGDTLDLTLARLESDLARHPAALVTVTGASNVTGELPPLSRIARIAHRHGARLAVDGAQLVPHRAVDLVADGIDYLAFSGHKVYAPFGAGVLVGRRDWLDAAAPHQPGGGAVTRVTLDDVEWATGPARHEGGTPNILGAIALAAACDAICALGWGTIVAHERELSARLDDGLRSLGIEPLRVWHGDHVGIASFTVPRYDAATAAAYLSAEHGIGVRDGRFCAHPLLDRFGIEGGAIRVSLGLRSSAADVDTLLDALRLLLEVGPRWTYVRTDHGVVPSPDPRELPDWAGGAIGGAASPCSSGSR